MNETNWLPGIIFAASGMILAVVVLMTARKKGAGNGAQITLHEIEHRLELVMDQLKAVDSDRHQLSAEGYVAEKTRLETEAAAALRDRDEHLRKHKAKLAPVESAPAPESPGNAQLRGAIWGAGIVLFVACLAYVLTNAQQARQPDAPMTGGNAAARGSQQQMPAQLPRLEDDPNFAAALQRAEQNPKDAAAAALVAHEFIWAGRMEEADRFTQRALAADPAHLESRIHAEALKVTQGGPVQAAIDQLGELGKSAGGYEALLFRGAMAMETGNLPVALESFERYSEQAPGSEQPPMLQQTIAMLRERAAQSAQPAKP